MRGDFCVPCVDVSTTLLLITTKIKITKSLKLQLSLCGRTAPNGRLSVLKQQLGQAKRLPPASVSAAPDRLLAGRERGSWLVARTSGGRRRANVDDGPRGP